MDIDNGYTKIERYNPETLKKLAHHYKEILTLIGEDSSREGLLDTPMRVAKAMQFFTHGYDEDPVEILRSATFHEDYKQMVIVKEIEIYSLCEHHMVPMVGKAHVDIFQMERLLVLVRSLVLWNAMQEGFRFRKD